MVGQTLAHYKILEKIGAGGMGDVYLAEDTKLDRKVALKVLPPDLAESEERRARFQREAKAIAALNHPNIVHIYSVEEADGVHFITMELVKGKTLAELLPKNGFPLGNFLEIAIPLTDAVATAHEQGIVHRDLKPSNVMVADDGRVKVLDFGLAKAAAKFLRPNVGSEAPTAAKTDEGVIVGTVSYMSPEQAEAKSVDHRTDIFSLGIVLYGMATGQPPFRGDSAASIVSSILKDDPVAVSELEPRLPSELSKIVRRCLVKDAEHRYQSAKDVRNELEELKQELDSGALTLPRPPAVGVRRIPLVGFSLVALASMFAIAVWYLSRPSGPKVPRFTNPVQLTSAEGLEDYPSWSPDGQTVAYHSNQSGNWDIWVAQVGGGRPVNRTADHEGADQFPSWSPDGLQIAFTSSRDGRGCYVIPSLGGPARRLVTVPRTGLGPPQWLSNGTELACVVRDFDGEVLSKVGSAVSGETRSLPFTSPHGEGPIDLSWSPNGQYVAYLDVWSHSVTSKPLIIQRIADGETFLVSEGRISHPSWSRDGSTLFFVSDLGGSLDLWRQAIHRDGSPVGDPEPLTTGIGMRSASFSRDETKLAYSKGANVANIWRVSILSSRPATWSDAEQLTFEQARAEVVDVTPDGKRLVFDSDANGNGDVWTLALGNDREPRQLTMSAAGDWAPALSPNGEEVVFYSRRGEGVEPIPGSRGADLWIMSVQGGTPRRLGQSGHKPSWSPDGREIAFSSFGTSDIWTVAREGGEPRQVTNTPAEDDAPRYSPDGESLSFFRARTGETRLWLIPSRGEEPEQLTTRRVAKGHAWSLDGEHVYFVDRTAPERNIWAVSVRDRSERQLTDLSGKPGELGGLGLATDGRYLYFTWVEDLGDIWVMDVITDEDD